jgi:hypothetical protein
MCVINFTLFPSRSLSKPPRLVASSPPPGRTGAALGGVAMRSRQRDCAGFSFRGSFSLRVGQWI